MRLCRLFGIGLRLNPWFFALLLVLSLTGRLWDSLLGFLLVVIHEGGHAWIARRGGLALAEIELFPFGGVARMAEPVELDSRLEIRVAVAGPLTNALLAAAAWWAAPWLGQLGAAFADPAELVHRFVEWNLWLGGVNLVPVLPLDGGRILRAVLASRCGFARATRGIVRFSRAASGAALLALVLAWMAGAPRPSGIVLAAFVYWAATKEGALAPYVFMRVLARKRGELAVARCLEGRLLVAAAGTPVKEVVWRFATRRYHLVCVLDTDGNVVGLATERQLIDGLFGRGLDTPVGELVRPWRH
ncbi:MAG TPA: site-2 protease family protein [Limnochordia bacterium]